MHNVNREKLIKIGLILFAVLSLIPVYTIALYARPCVDDYGHSLMTHELVQSGEWNVFSLIKTAWMSDMHIYEVWEGCFVTNFVQAFMPGIFDEKYYFIGVWILLILILACILYFVLTVTRILGLKKWNWILAILSYLIVVQGIPHPEEGIYWLNGAWKYTPNATLILLNMAIVAKCIYFFEKSKGKTITLTILSTVISFIISGGNQVTAFANILLLILIFIAIMIKAKSKTTLVCAGMPLVSAVVGFIIVMIAPGTAVRQNIVNKTGLVKTIIKGIWGCYKYFSSWINIQWICMMILLVPLTIYLVKEIGITREKLPFHPIIILLASLMVICGMNCVPAMAMGALGAGRVENVVWMMFIFLSIGNGIYFLIYYLGDLFLKREFVFRGWAPIVTFAFLIFAMSFNQKSTGFEALYELGNGTAKNYADACQVRYDAMDEYLGNNSSNLTEPLQFEMLPESKLLRYDDITPYTDNWKNQEWLSFYGISAITIEPVNEYP